MTQQEIDLMVQDYLNTEFIRHLLEDNSIPTLSDRIAHAIRWTASRMDSDWILPEGAHIAAIDMEEVE